MRYAVYTTMFSAVLAGTASAQPAEPARINVVKTWQELQAQPAIKLEGGLTLRLGIEADRVPQWSGALLYCLTDGYAPPLKWNDEGSLGPVYLHFARGDTIRQRRPIKVVEAGSEREAPKATYLFARPIVVHSAAPLHVRISTAKDRIIATARLEGTKDLFHPWMPWLEGYDKPTAPCDGIAVPNVDRFGPVASVKPGDVRTGDLPTFWASGATQSLTLAIEPNLAVVQAQAPFTTSRPELHFLARWWVNDKPYVPTQAERLWLFTGYGAVSEGKELRLPVEFRLGRLGARGGDKIGLQLLHCKNGWHWCDGKKHGGLEVLPHGNNVRLSNRVDFIAPAHE
jgi:hypothetical protein